MDACDTTLSGTFPQLRWTSPPISTFLIKKWIGRERESWERKLSPAEKGHQLCRPQGQGRGFGFWGEKLPNVSLQLTSKCNNSVKCSLFCPKSCLPVDVLIQPLCDSISGFLPQWGLRFQDQRLLLVYHPQLNAEFGPWGLIPFWCVSSVFNWQLHRRLWTISVPRRTKHRRKMAYNLSFQCSILIFRHFLKDFVFSDHVPSETLICGWVIGCSLSSHHPPTQTLLPGSQCHTILTPWVDMLQLLQIGSNWKKSKVVVLPGQSLLVSARSLGRAQCRQCRGTQEALPSHKEPATGNSAT